MDAATATRLHVESPLAVGAAIEIGADRAHYLRDVLRLKAGAVLRLFNGRDGEWRATLDAIGKSAARLSVASQLRPQAGEPDLWLVFAGIKRLAVDLLAEKATELGVAALLPAITQRTNVDRVNAARLRAIAIAAAEQCERLTVPEVREAARLDRLIGGWPPARRLLLCAEAGPARPIADVLASFKAGYNRETAGGWAIMIGPEGGFARDELDALANLPFVTPVGLGPRILRAETAALAALACWQAVLGDGAARPAFRSIE